MCGSAGCGKTLLAHGVPRPRRRPVRRAGRVHGLRGDGEELAKNVASAGLRSDRTWWPARSSSSTTSTSSAAKSRRPASTTWKGCSSGWATPSTRIGAKRVVLDTIEALFAGLPNEAILRAELRRLFRWLKDKGVTAIITGERGDEHPDPPRAGGVRLRLRHPPGPSGV